MGSSYYFARRTRGASRIAPAGGGGGGASPVWVFDPDGYGSIAAAIGDTTVWSTGEAQNTARLSLQAGNGPTGGNAVRFSQQIGDAAEFTITLEAVYKNGPPPSGGTRYGWLEFWGRFMTGYKTNCATTAENPDYKWIFGTTNSGRFETKFGQSMGANAGAPHGIVGGFAFAAMPSSPTLFPDGGASDDQWDTTQTATTYPASPSGPYLTVNDQVWRQWRLEMGCSTSSGATDGFYRVWVDGVKTFEFLNISTASDRNILRPSFGHNFNRQQDANQWWELGKSQYWTSPPSWATLP